MNVLCNFGCAVQRAHSTMNVLCNVLNDAHPVKVALHYCTSVKLEFTFLTYPIIKFFITLSVNEDIRILTIFLIA